MGLFQQLIKELDTKTDAEGRFILRALPTRASVAAKVTAPGFGAPQVHFDLSGPVTIRLGRAGSISGSLTSTADPKAGAGVEVRVALQPGDAEPKATGFRLAHHDTTTSANDGKFRFHGLTPGKYQVSANVDRQSGFYAEETPTADVAPGATVSGVTIGLRRGIRLEGRVVDKQTGAGIGDVRLTVYRKMENSLRWAGSVTTDAEGKYFTYVRPGNFSVRVSSAPEQYQVPSRQRRVPSKEVTKDSTWPDIQLGRAGRVEGIVVDASGKPVPQAEVRVLTSDDRRERDLTSDSNGKFTLKQLPPKEALQVRARTETAVTDGVVPIVPAETKGQAKLVVSEKHAFHLTGTVVDEAGSPVRDAPLDVRMLWWAGSFGIGFSIESLTTDLQGRFKTRALWPGDRYHVVVTAEDYEKWESAEVAGQPGQTHDFGSIALRGTGGRVEGTVVDSGGRPIPEVQVFNNGDGPRPVTARTDAAGAFRLEGLFAGPVYVFARKEGHRFTGVRVASGTCDVVIKLLGRDEPVPPRETRPPAPSFAQQKETARKLLETLWEVRGKGSGNRGARGVIRAMERIDPDKARAWSAEIGQSQSESVSRAEVEKIAETDPDEALALLAEMGNTSAYYTLKSLATRYLASDKDKAARFAEEAVLRARTLDQPRRTWSLAAVGALVIRLGSKEAGLKLIGEAAEMAGNLGIEGHQALARGLVAEALAPHDLKRALQLVEPIKDRSDRSRYLSMVAVAIGTKDPDKALELVGELDAQSINRVRMRIAYRLASAKPDQAVRIVEEMAQREGYGLSNSKTKAEAFGWLAVAIAPQDKPLACSLIDRALAIYLDDPEGFRTWSSYGGRSGFAAGVAAQAHQIGYPDMQSVVHRVLAARPTTAGSYSPTEGIKSVVRMAMLLAVTDPGVARDLLRRVESRSDLLGSGGSSSINRRYWFQAWALADPDHAVELFEKELAALADKRDFSPSESGLLPMAEILALPPEERANKLRRDNGAFWFPGEE